MVEYDGGASIQLHKRRFFDIRVVQNVQKPGLDLFTCHSNPGFSKPGYDVYTHKTEPGY